MLPRVNIRVREGSQQRNSIMKLAGIGALCLTSVFRISGETKQFRDGVGDAMEDKIVDENAAFDEHCDDR